MACHAGTESKTERESYAAAMVVAASANLRQASKRAGQAARMGDDVAHATVETTTASLWLAAEEDIAAR